MPTQEIPDTLFERIPNNDETPDWLTIGALNGVVKSLLIKNDLISYQDGVKGIDFSVNNKTMPDFVFDQAVVESVFPDINSSLSLQISLPKPAQEQINRGQNQGNDYTQRNGIKLKFRTETNTFFECELYPGSCDKVVGTMKDKHDKNLDIWESLTNNEVKALVQLIETGNPLATERNKH